VDVHRAYCSAVDRNVPVTLRPGAPPRSLVTLSDPADLICLDYKVRCTGWCCPLYSVSDDMPDGALASVPAGAGTRSGVAARPSRSRPRLHE
jgi:hypothetical protein